MFDPSLLKNIQNHSRKLQLVSWFVLNLLASLSGQENQIIDNVRYLYDTSCQYLSNNPPGHEFQPFTEFRPSRVSKQDQIWLSFQVDKNEWPFDTFYIFTDAFKSHNYIYRQELIDLSTGESVAGGSWLPNGDLPLINNRFAYQHHLKIYPIRITCL